MLVLAVVPEQFPLLPRPILSWQHQVPHAFPVLSLSRLCCMLALQTGPLGICDVVYKALSEEVQVLQTAGTI